MLEENLSEGNHEVNFNRASLAAGIYFLQLKMNNVLVVKQVAIK